MVGGLGAGLLFLSGLDGNAEGAGIVCLLQASVSSLLAGDTLLLPRLSVLSEVSLVLFLNMKPKTP